MKLAVGAAVLMVLVLPLRLMAEETLSIDIEASGSADVRFVGLDIAAVVVGDVDLTASLTSDSGIVRLSATGAVSGDAIHHSLTWVGKGWIVLAAIGQTTTGEPVSLVSLLFASRQNLVLLQSGDPIEGAQHTVIDVAGDREVFHGTFAGTLAGGLAPSQSPGTIRLSGSGTLLLSGASVPEAESYDFPDVIPLDDPDLPGDLLALIRQLFGCPPPQNPGAQ
jgi:hypothetical protein